MTGAALIAFLALLGCCTLAAGAAKPNPPGRVNIVYILCDDLGYGDVQCLNPARGKIATPNIDRLAGQGMVFTDAHSSSAVCTPTRYGILTGRYNWRTRLQSGVLFGYDKPLIAEDRLTVPALLKQHGYATACIGKWHLGMQMPPSKEAVGPLGEGPVTRGFDYFFGISASLDMPPFAFIENDRFTQAPTASKTWMREGPAAPDFEAEDVLPTLARKACEYIGARAGEGKPFFLYLPLTLPHTPLVPTKEWRGKSGLGEYGDFVMETDWAVGEVLAALDAHGIAENTLIIFTSDNGFAPYVGVEKMEKQGHYPSADRRGYKADIFDGGHRIPFIARWPGKIKPGTRSDQLICLTDLMATCAELVGAKLPDNAGEDSASLLPVLTGAADKPFDAAQGRPFDAAQGRPFDAAQGRPFDAAQGRPFDAAQGRPVHEAVVHHSINGKFAIRQGKWKLELCAGSGGWSEPKDGEPGLPPVQLYDMTQDVGEQKNLQAEHPEIVEALTALLDKYVAEGRSTPGAPQTNDVPVKLQKPRKQPAKAPAVK